MLRHTQLVPLAMLVVFALCPTGAAATAQRTFVASTGSDANPCSLVAPCRSFAAAVAQTNASGEVIVLDSAGYGPFAINKPLSVIAPSGIYAGVTVFSGIGIDVSGTVYDVTLRGLSINGQGGSYGIVFTNGSRLIVDRCEISNMTSAGIKIDGSSLPVTAVTISNARIERSSRGVDVASYADVSIVDSRFSYNGTGVFVSPTTYTSRVSIHRTIIDHSSSDGVAVDGGSQTAIVSISGSELDGNFFGVNAFHSKALVHVSDSRLVSNEIYGVIEQYSANVVLSGNLIGTNGTSGVQNNDAGFVYTMKNNAIRDNGLYNLLKPLTTLTFD